jgi:hypothetical protein
MTTVLIKRSKDKKKNAMFGGMSEEFNVYGLEEGTNRMISSTGSYDLFGTGAKLNTYNLSKHPRIFFEAECTEANILVFDLSIVKAFDKYGKEFDTLTQGFIPFLLENQYNETLLKTIQGEPEENTVQDYFNKNIENLNEFRPFAYITPDYCM